MPPANDRVSQGISRYPLHSVPAHLYFEGARSLESNGAEIYEAAILRHLHGL